MDFDAAEEKVTYRLAQEDNDVRELASEERKLYDAHSRYGEMAKVATIPMILYNSWRREGKIKDQAFIKRWLNDTYNSAFRTRPGRI